MNTLLEAGKTQHVVEEGTVDGTAGPFDVTKVITRYEKDGARVTVETITFSAGSDYEFTVTNIHLHGDLPMIARTYQAFASLKIGPVTLFLDREDQRRLAHALIDVEAS